MTAGSGASPRRTWRPRRGAVFDLVVALALQKATCQFSVVSDQPPQPPNQQYEYQKLLHAAYKELRTEADKIALEIGGRYEKMLSLVAGGSLAVSLTFIEKIAPSPIEWSRWIALAAWLLLGSAIVATMLAIAGSQLAQQKKIENMDSEILQRLYPEDERYKNVDIVANPYVQRVHCANTVSLYSAILGLLCLIGFVFVNFPTAKNYEQQKPATTATTERQQTKHELLRPNEGTSPAAPAAPSSSKGKIDVPKSPNQPPPAAPPTGNTGTLTESYVPTAALTPPPPPPQSPPPKQGT